MKKAPILILLLIASGNEAWSNGIYSAPQGPAFIATGLTLIIMIALASILLIRVLAMNEEYFRPRVESRAEQLLSELDEQSIDTLLTLREKFKKLSRGSGKTITILLLLGLPSTLQAQSSVPDIPSLFSQSGIIITLVLIAIPMVFAVIFLFLKVSNLIQQIRSKRNENEAEHLADLLYQAEDVNIDASLLKRKAILNYVPPSLVNQHHFENEDERGTLNSVNVNFAPNIVSEKKRQRIGHITPVPQANLILWFLGTAVFWLLFGTTAGEYLGIKFVSPEADSISWLSFGRLRPVHTNAVFWGWSSLAMMGLAYYVVPTVSNSKIASKLKGWVTLVLINSSVLIGSLCLMAGINNGGGEYREYIWPVMALFGAGLFISLINFIQTISQRQSKEIYISNWYIVSAIIFTLIVAFVAYWPTWQNGLGETIVQGYYMHQGVGMWFMLFNLGLVYYFLPQQVNKPIYSYGLGILAFWSQIVFYTLIGTHHFVFSSIPWWLQTVAIVGSVGMVIPVVAGTTNFFMTFKGSWNKLSSSYTLPFFFVGILFYFIGSLQGTAEAFRFTNLLWHFTDFTVAHSHLTMYGIIAFLLWGCIYVLVPRITGKEPSQLLTGMHFWMAFVGLMFYSVSLMIGGTLKGLSWMEGRFFIESLNLMAPFWLWRAIGGTLMWLSHIVFAFNFYKMVAREKTAEVKSLTIEKLNAKLNPVNV